MRHALRFVSLILLCGFLFSCGSPRAAAPELQFLDEIGHLGSPFETRTSAQLGPALVTAADESFLFQGRGENGERWEATLPVRGGIGFTDVWQADFDGNSHQDLLVVAHFPGNGRCIDRVSLSFLMFDENGQPIPWVVETHMAFIGGTPRIPALLADVDNNGSLEFIATDCEYSAFPRNGEDRSITGVYVANNTAWSLVKPTDSEPYEALIRQSFRVRPEFDELLPTNVDAWTDQGNRIEDTESPGLRVTAVLEPSESCKGPLVHLEEEPESCEELGRDRFELSDGTTCYGWPTIMLDSNRGREIVAGSLFPRELLQEILEQEYSVILAGQREPDRCSPSLLWASPAP